MSKDVSNSVEHQLRQNSGQIKAVLTRIFGVGNLDNIEDAVQEALIKALRVWAIKGVPKNQTAWLIQVAKNHLYDQFRIQNRHTGFDEEFKEAELIGELVADPGFFEDEIAEDQLRMIFACCHPLIPKDSQVALTLKTVGGFNNREIAHAFLAKKSAIDKILVRAKSRLKKHRENFEIPGPDKLSSRLDAVLKVIYLIFNEGYMASEGNELIRKDLCNEAIRLIQLLASYPVTNSPKVNALAGLLHFHGSRLGSRTRDNGVPTLLSEQDRSTWDRSMILKGLAYMKGSASGNEISTYHLEMEIASHHALAPSFENTDWSAILSSYEDLYKLNPSPIVGLNLAFAIGKVHGPESGLIAIKDLKAASLEEYYPFHLISAEFYEQLGMKEEARVSYSLALENTNNDSVKTLVKKRLDAVVSLPAQGSP